MSVSGRDEEQRPITILRDTACSQSLNLFSMLPLSAKSDESTVVRGIEMGFVPAPLHRIHVRSEIVTGFFKGGVREKFPIDGVDFIMGNAIAGGKVYPVPKVVEVPIRESNDVAGSGFVASMQSRAQAPKKVQEIKLADALLGSIFSKKEVTSGSSAVSQVEGEPKRETAMVAELPMMVAREALLTAQKTFPGRE